MRRVAHITRQLAEDIREANRCDAAAGLVPCRHVNCLLVEDDDSDAILTLEAIQSVGGVVATRANTGDAAIRLLVEANDGDRPPFDIVFVDLKLQGSDAQGGEVVQAIRRRFPQTHIVIISGHLGQNVLDSMTGGYVGVIQKPLVAENLNEILNKHRLRPA